MFERTRKRDTILKNVIKTHRIQSCLKPTFVSPKVRGYMVSVSYTFVGVFLSFITDMGHMHMKILTNQY